MNLKLFPIIVLTILTVTASVAAITTTPEMMAARRVHQRFAAESFAARDSLILRGARAAVAQLMSARPLRPAHRLIERRNRRRLDLRIPGALDRVVRQLRSGATLPLALRSVGQDDPVFARISAELGQGRSLSDTVEDWRQEDELPNRQLTATALDLASRTGGASARVLDGVAASLRERVALEREVAALSSQARASAIVLVVAPVVFAAAASMVDRRILDLLVGQPIGWACLGVGLGLDALGAVWMSRLIGRHR
jgi:tight adherence protein B